MIKRVEKVFSEVTGRDDLEFTPKTKINKIPGLSSLGVIQIVCGIEDEFDIAIPNSVVKKIKTVGDILKYLEKNA